MELQIRRDDLRGPEVAALLRRHLEHSAQHSPPESVHALDLDRLRRPDITFWTAWSDGLLVGCGGLQELAPDHGEIKSMHTAEEYRGRGIAARLLGHLLEEARVRRYRRVSLETGSPEAFAPARALYARHGFQTCPPFASYREDPYSVYMTLELLEGPGATTGGER